MTRWRLRLRVQVICRPALRPEPNARLGFCLYCLEAELAATCGRPVDLVARKSINTDIRERVLAEVQSFHAA